MARSYEDECNHFEGRCGARRNGPTAPAFLGLTTRRVRLSGARHLSTFTHCFHDAR